MAGQRHESTQLGAVLDNAGGGGGDLLDPHKRAALSQPRVAPERGATALASRLPGAQALAGERRQGAPRYERNLKRRLVLESKDLLKERLPYCEIRYGF